MYSPPEKVLKSSVDFSFTSSRAIFRIHARLRQLVAQLQEYWGIERFYVCLTVWNIFRAVLITVSMEKLRKLLCYYHG